MALVAGDLPVSSDPVKTSRSPSSKRRKSRSKGFGSPEYMRQTLRPVICLAFVLPLIFIHELGLINSDQLSGRSGIDQWLSWFLNLVGGGHLVVLPVVTAGTLLYFHHQLEDDWRFKPYVLFGMLAESFCLGAILFFAGNALYQMFSADYAANTTIAQASGLNAISCWSTTITYIGAGVYEEVIFRLLLLNGLIYVGKFYLSKTEAKFAAIILTSLIFAAVHYHFCNPAGVEFDAHGFFFRFFASLIFCFLFLFRGFGVAVGAHVVYDILTQV